MRALQFDDLPAGGKERLFIYVQNAGTYKPLVVNGLSGASPPFSASVPANTSLSSDRGLLLRPLGPALDDFMRYAEPLRELQ